MFAITAVFGDGARARAAGPFMLVITDVFGDGARAGAAGPLGSIPGFHSSCPCPLGQRHCSWLDTEPCDINLKECDISAMSM